jgi:malate dehydrogenase
VSFIAIVGSGPIGGALAHKLAGRDRVSEVRLIDPEGRVAEGKALDIRQSSPIEGFSTRVTSSTVVAAAAGASVVVVADQANGEGEYAGETGLALMRQLAAIEADAPIVCAGAAQRELIARAIGELHYNRARLVGSAPGALESALRALAGLAVDGSGVEVSLRVIGVPPGSAVVAWEEATAFGQPISASLTPHEISALSARIPRLWPPAAYALASAASRVVEALANGSRRRFSCFVGLSRTQVAAMPVELSRDGVRRVLEPALTRQERTLFENALEKI